MSSGYLLQAVAEEKENRTIEVLVTSVSPLQLVAGKVVGIAGVSLTQLAAWALFSFLALAAARRAGIGWLQDMSLDWGPVLASAALAIPCFILASALMVAAGATLTASQESQSAGTFFSVLHALPLWLAWAIVSSPHSALSVTSLSCPSPRCLRWSCATSSPQLPTGQVAVALVAQTLYAVAAIWLASRAFRLGMLRYGKRLGLRDLVQARGR